METRKITSSLCIAALAAGMIAGGAGALTANAQTFSAAQITKENSELFLPTSYEQYLPLQDPSYMALSERHIAVADGTLMYVYDRENGAYTDRKSVV